MLGKLAESLVNKGVLTPGMEVEARYHGLGLGGTENIRVTGDFMIHEIFAGENGNIIFGLKSTSDGKSKRLSAETIITIDGMDPDRFASVYDVKPDGTDKKAGKRRGRRPKDRSINNGGDNRVQLDPFDEDEEAA